MQVKLGDIYTNGVNFWIVTMAIKTQCLSCGNPLADRIQLNPIVANGDFSRGEIWFLDKIITRVEDIKPHAWKVGEIKLYK